MSACPNKRTELACGNNADIRLAPARHQQFLAFSGGIEQVRIPAQGSQSHSLHVRQYVCLVGIWQVVFNREFMEPSHNLFEVADNFAASSQGSSFVATSLRLNCLSQLVTRFRQELGIHRRSFLSSSENASAAGIPVERPASYRLILSRISRSQAAAAPASGGGSTLASMRCANVNLWSLGRSNASEVIFSSVAAML